MIHGLSFNPCSFLVSFLMGAVSSRSLSILLKKRAKPLLVSVAGELISVQSVFFSSSSNSRLLKMRQLREEVEFLLILWVSWMSSWQNCRKWSEMEQVMFPPLEKVDMSLIKMLSIRVADLLDTLVG